MNDFKRQVGLPGAGHITVEIHIDGPFTLSPQERELLYTITDALNKFQDFCEQERLGKST